MSPLKIAITGIKREGKSVNPKSSNKSGQERTSSRIKRGGETLWVFLERRPHRPERNYKSRSASRSRARRLLRVCREWIFWNDTENALFPGAAFRKKRPLRSTCIAFPKPDIQHFRARVQAEVCPKTKLLMVQNVCEDLALGMHWEQELFRHFLICLCVFQFMKNVQRIHKQNLFPCDFCGKLKTVWKWLFP